MKDTLPNLKIAPVNKLLLHENVETRRVAKLRQAYAKDGYMLNPIIVSKVKDGRFLVLDGANRATVFKQLRIPHIVVQIVPYRPPFVKLQTWNHLISDPQFRRLHAKSIKRFVRKDPKGMDDFVKLYNGQFSFHRVASGDFASLKRQYRNVTCLVIFPRLRPRDIIRFALSQQRIPTGITRHIVQGRALRLKFPLSVLKSKKTTVAKQQILDRMIAEAREQNHVRAYYEPVYLFDEY